LVALCCAIHTQQQHQQKKQQKTVGRTTGRLLVNGAPLVKAAWSRVVGCGFGFIVWRALCSVLLF
jgi:hypothetical protein